MTIELKTLQLQRAVIEVFGGCNYTCKMCPQGTATGREPHFLRKMGLTQFESILDQITPKYGHPIINMEGSGEPTMAKDLPRYIQACTDRNLPSFIYCNGARFQGQFMRDCIDAGLSLIRFSVIGYNAEKYAEWMNVDNWDLIVSNAKAAIAYRDATNSTCSIDSYHLVTDPDNADWEVQQYRDNFITPVGTKAYVWKMHNWSGNHNTVNDRTGSKRTCGRPDAAELTVRAGGINNQLAAVTPCCQVLGPPSESKSVLGHFSTQTFEEIWTGDLYTELRDKHATGDFDSIPYCKDCDFLIGDPEVLAWSNDPTAQIGKPMGTTLAMKS